MKINAGIDWDCPAWGINWHTCYGYWNFNFYPFWVNIEYRKIGDDDKWDDVK